MPRPLRIQYPGAIYHVMNRGDRGEPIFHDDADRKCFLATLTDACGKTSWQIHAYCLMHNHFHLVLETPDSNLVLGMKWLSGTYTTRFNRRHGSYGHLFSGRYKALIVDQSGNGYLRTVCDYVHLNPVRAGLLRAEQKLADFAWSSWPEYLKLPERRPGWLRVDRWLGELGIPHDSKAGRLELERYLEARRVHADGSDYQAIRSGWCLGTEAFRKELMESVRTMATEHHIAQPRQETAEAKAQRLLSDELDRLRLTRAELSVLPKGDARKVAVAMRLRSETAVTLKWIAAELHMGSWTYVSNLLAQARHATQGGRSKEH